MTPAEPRTDLRRLAAFVARYEAGQDVGEAVGLESDLFVSDLRVLLDRLAAAESQLNILRQENERITKTIGMLPVRQKFDGLLAAEQQARAALKAYDKAQINGDELASAVRAALKEQPR
jgi:hypothetical protein